MEYVAANSIPTGNRKLQKYFLFVYAPVRKSFKLQTKSVKYFFLNTHYTYFTHRQQNIQEIRRRSKT